MGHEEEEVDNRKLNKNHNWTQLNFFSRKNTKKNFFLSNEAFHLRFMSSL